MSRTKLTLDRFFDRIVEELAGHPGPRRRIQGEQGLLLWRSGRLKAGVRVTIDPGRRGACVFLGDAWRAIDSVTEAVDLLEGVFAGEIVEVKAFGDTAEYCGLAHADDPGRFIAAYDQKYRAVDVPVMRRIAVRAWKADGPEDSGLPKFETSRTRI